MVGHRNAGAICASRTRCISRSHRTRLQAATCIAVEFVAITRTQARSRAKELVSQGQLAQSPVQGFVDDLVEESRRRSDSIVEVVRQEIGRQVKTLGIATKEDLARLEAKLARVFSGGTSTPRPTTTTVAKKASPAKKTAAKKTAAKKTAAKKTVAKKTGAKKTVVKKPAAKKTAVKKTGAKKAAAKKTTAKQTAPAARVS